MQDSIIVYRNPLEKAIWENPLPIIWFAAVMFVTFGIIFFTCKLIHVKYTRGKNKYSQLPRMFRDDGWTLWVAIPGSIICAILALIYLPV